VSFRSIVQKRWSTVHRSGALFIGAEHCSSEVLFTERCYCSKAVEHCSSERSTVHRRYCSPNVVIVQKRWSTVHRSGALFIGGTVHRTLLLFIWYCSLTLFIKYCSPTLYTGTVHRTLLLFIWYCSLNTVHSTVHWHCTRVLFQNYGKESFVNRQHCCLRRLGFKWDRCDPSSLSWELS
jgi:hypothetical protein